MRRKTFCSRGLILAAAMASAFGCAAPENQGVGGADPSGFGGEANASGATLSFVDGSSLTATPSETVELQVRVTPALRQTVTFEILSSSDGFDGYLTSNTSRVDDDGYATVSLVAPSTPSTFLVRAFLDTKTEARIAVSVGDQGFGTIVLTPAYAGSRVISKWFASAHLGKSCEELTTLFEDSLLTASSSGSVTLKNVPAGQVLALSLRGDKLSSGCVTLASVEANKTSDLTIPATDRPVDLSNGTLAGALGVDATTDEFAGHLESSITNVLGLFRGAQKDDGAALLDWMRWRLNGSDLSSFDDNRTNYGLDSVALAQLGGETISSNLRNQLTNAAALIPGDSTFSGEWELQGSTSKFSLISAAGVDAANAGFSPTASFEMAVDSSDMVSLGGALQYRPVAWLSALATENASAQSIASPLAQLSTAAECGALAAQLEQAVGGNVYGSCDASCLSAVCEGALQDVWQMVQSDQSSSQLHVGATGKASLTSDARLAGTTGSWVGRIDSGTVTSMKGPLQATRK